MADERAEVGRLGEVDGVEQRELGRQAPSGVIALPLGDLVRDRLRPFGRGRVEIGRGVPVVARRVGQDGAAVGTGPAVEAFVVAAHDHVGDARFGQDLGHLGGPAGDVRIEVDCGVGSGEGPLQPQPPEIRLPDELLARKERFVGLVVGGSPLHPALPGQAADLAGALGMALEIFSEIEHVLHGEGVGGFPGHHGQGRGDAVRVAEDDALLRRVHPGDVLVARGDDVEPARRDGRSALALLSHRSLPRRRPPRGRQHDRRGRGRERDRYESFPSPFAHAILLDPRLSPEAGRFIHQGRRGPGEAAAGSRVRPCSPA